MGITRVQLSSGAYWVTHSTKKRIDELNKNPINQNKISQIIESHNFFTRGYAVEALHNSTIQKIGKSLENSQIEKDVNSNKLKRLINSLSHLAASLFKIFNLQTKEKKNFLSSIPKEKTSEIEKKASEITQYLEAKKILSHDDLLILIKFLKVKKLESGDLENSIELLELSVRENIFTEATMRSEASLMKIVQKHYSSDPTLVERALIYTLRKNSVKETNKSKASSSNAQEESHSSSLQATFKTQASENETRTEHEFRMISFLRSECGFNALKKELSIADYINILNYFQNHAPEADRSIQNLLEAYEKSKGTINLKLADEIQSKCHHLPYLVLTKNLGVDIGKISQIIQRTEKGGLYNLGNSCWFNALIQSQFRSDGVYYRALEKAASATLSFDRQKYCSRASALLRIINLLDETPTIEVNEELYDRLKSFLTHLFENSRGIAFGVQSDAQEGLDKLIDYLGLSHIGRPCDPSQATDAIDLIRKEMESETQMGISQIIFGERSGLGNPTLNKTSQIPLEIRPDAKTMQDLITAHSMAGERVERTNDPSFKMNYFFLEPEQLAPKEMTFHMRRYGFNLETLQPELISKPISINEELLVPVYNKHGTKVERILVLKLRDVVFKEGPTADSGHYISSKFEEGHTTLYDDAHVSHNTVRDAEKKSFLLTYTFVREIKEPAEISRFGYHTTHHYREDIRGLSKALDDLENTITKS